MRGLTPWWCVVLNDVTKTIVKLVPYECPSSRWVGLLLLLLKAHVPQTQYINEPEHLSATMTQQGQHQTQEAVVFSVVALASLFHNTVESFGNIHSSLNDSQDEKLLLTQLGIEQARLMIWGDLTGVFSPPASVADRSGELKPTMTEEGVLRPLYSRPRDERTDKDETRHVIEGILSALSYTLAPSNYNVRLDVNGLRPWQQGYAHKLEQPAVNADRLERLEERYQLLLKTAFAKAGMSRPQYTATTQWVISDVIRFSNFVKFTKVHVDKLVALLGHSDQVEEILKRDVQLLGESCGSNSKRMTKLSMLIKAFKGRYPFLVLEAKAALQRLQASSGEQSHPGKLHKITIPRLPISPKSQPGSPEGERRPNLLSRLSTQTAHTFRKSRPNTPGTAASRPTSPNRNSRI